MAPKRTHVREKRRLIYPEGKCSPDTFVHFVCLDSFVQRWRSLRLNDEDQRAAEMVIMADPKRWPVVAGTGGLRKVRFANPNWSRGKRGGVRIGYVYFEHYAIVLLVIAYGKNEKDDLSASEKKQIKALIEDTERFLNERGTR